MHWTITNFGSSCTPYLIREKFALYISEPIPEQVFTTIDGNTFLIDGYILPRVADQHIYKGLTQMELLVRVFSEHKADFINYIKGVFIIIVFGKDNFSIFNDHHGFKKYFFHSVPEFFIISNRINEIISNIETRSSPPAISRFVLFNHFLFGETLFKGIRYSLPATKLHFEKQFEVSTYWEVTQLFHENDKISIHQIADSWAEIIAGYINFFDPKGISLTLTGGNDSRMVLAGMLAVGVKPKTFTFGDPGSADSLVARDVADRMGLEHFNYSFDSVDCKWFENLAYEIICFGNTLINIHRAHRLDAVKRSKKDSDSEMLFTGLIGGEYIKEPDYNDITIPRIFRELQSIQTPDLQKKYIAKILVEKAILIDKLDLDGTLEVINDFLGRSNGLTEVQKKFFFTYHFYASVHHSQDPTVFSTGYKYVVSPFTDIDFLLALSRSSEWYVNKKSSFKFATRVFHSRLLVMVTDMLCPLLSEVQYAKKGAYTGKDLLSHPVVFLVKRIKNALMSGQSFKQNFPLGEWMTQFVNSQLSQLHKDIIDLIDENLITEKVELAQKNSREENWHPVTSLINASLNLKYYEKI